MGEQDDIQAVPPRVVTQLHFPDKEGRLYHLDYFRFPGKPQDPNRHNLEDYRLSGVRQVLERLGRRVFPNYDEQGLANLIWKFDAFSRFDLAYTSEGKLVAFHIYIMGEVQSSAGPVKVIYVSHAGTDPDYEGRGITRNVRNTIFDLENPDVVCGSSANGAVYVANQRIAKQRGMMLYPHDVCTLAPIVELANQIHDTLDIRNAGLDDRLVRTYKRPVSKGKMIHPLHGVLPLGETQHYFYMLLTPELNQALNLDRK